MGLQQTVVRIDSISGTAYDQFDKYLSKFYIFIIYEIEFYSPAEISCWQREAFPRSFHESQYDRWSRRKPTIVSSNSKQVGCVLHWVNRVNCLVWVRRKNLWLVVFEMHLIKAKVALQIRGSPCAGLPGLSYNKNIVTSTEQYCSFLKVSIT